MDFTDPKFVQAFMKSEEANPSNISAVFTPLMLSSKSIRETYLPERQFLIDEFTKEFLHLLRDYKQNKVSKIEMLEFLTSVTNFELLLVAQINESRFFDLRDKQVKIVSEQSNKKPADFLYKDRALLKRLIFIEQAKLLEEFIDLGYPMTPKLEKFIEENLYIYADILSRTPDQLISAYDFNTKIVPMSSYQNYYYRLFDSDVDIYKQDKQTQLAKIKKYLD